LNLLAIVQSLHHEAKLAGSAPSTVVGQVGRAADLVRWAIEAYNDIQRDRDAKWKWLRGDWYFDTVADTSSYVYTAVYDTDTAAFITRFRAWELDEREPPLLYLSADGQSTERELAIWDFRDFRYRYIRATHTAAYPAAIAAKVTDALFLGPTPDAVYRVSGMYWKDNQELAADSDTPEMPANFHMAIVYRALVKYGYDSVSPEVLARAEVDGKAIWESLVNNQSYSRYSWSTNGPLA
jgi:hypothetical protein